MWKWFPSYQLTDSKCPLFGVSLQAWHAWAVMNFEAVLHYKHQNQGRDEKKKRRHASGASANSEASNSDSEADSTDHSPVPSPRQVNEVGVHQDPFKTVSVPFQSNQKINLVFMQDVKNHQVVSLLSAGPLQDFAPLHRPCCSRILPLHFPLQRK